MAGPTEDHGSVAAVEIADCDLAAWCAAGGKGAGAVDAYIIHGRCACADLCDWLVYVCATASLGAVDSDHCWDEGSCESGDHLHVSHCRLISDVVVWRRAGVVLRSI